MNSTSTTINAIIETSIDAFIGMDDQGRVTHWNHAAVLTFGWDKSEAIGRCLSDLIVPADMKECHEQGMQRYLATGISQILNQRITMQAVRKCGELFLIEMTISVHQDDGKHIFFAFLHDNQERHRAESVLQQLARTDSLTDLANRRFLYERLQDTMNRVRRTKRLMAVLFMDIDHFKKVNDSLGHNVGDQVLREFAARLVSSVREVDFVARLGGDEFMVVAEELADEKTAAVIATKIIARIAAEFPLGDASLQITTSIGIAVFEGQEMDMDELIRRADQAMYQAKRSGRNTFRLARADEPPALLPNTASAPAPLSFFIMPKENMVKSGYFIQESLRAVRAHLRMDVAFISKFHAGERVFQFVDAEAADPPIVPGGADPLEDSYCQRVVDGRLPEIIPDAFLNLEAASMAVTHALPVRAHLSVPIVLKTGQIYGTYCCFSYTADQSLNERDRSVMRIFADLVAREVEKEPAPGA